MSQDWEQVCEMGVEEEMVLEKLDLKLTEGASQYGNFNRRYLIRKTLGAHKRNIELFPNKTNDTKGHYSRPNIYKQDRSVSKGYRLYI